MIMYISTLHNRIKGHNVQNVKLLDAMHKSLLILSKEVEKSVLFSNRPCQKLLEAAIDESNESDVVTLLS